MPKIKAVAIQIERAEGPVKECVSRRFEGDTCWEQVNQQLVKWAHTAPKLGYDKCDFTIFFADGETYQGRFDNERLDHPDREKSLAEHVLSHARFCAGQFRPDHLSEEQYEQVLALAEQSTPGIKAEYTKFLTDYEIPGAS